jgi:threonine dehydrogenase-like Zn-dependent dehydrogenase
MLAVILDDGLDIREVPAPVPAEGEALVRVQMAGICGTDLALLSGYKNFRGIIGHEMVGIVEDAPDSSWSGERVVAEINISCGTCSLCREGHRKHCEKRQVMGVLDRPGVFAERVAVPLDNLHRVPESVTDEEATWAEPLAAALAVADAGIRKGDPVLVLGDGRLGSLIALGLQHGGASVEVVGKQKSKLSRLESLGVKVKTGGPVPEYPWVVEATGSVSGLEQALAWTKPRGTLILKSTCHEPVTFDASKVVVHEIRVVGSRCGDFPPALDALASGRIPVRSLVSSVYPLVQAKEAFAKCARPSTVKVLFDLRQ